MFVPKNILILLLAFNCSGCNSNTTELSDAEFDSALIYAKVQLAVYDIAQANRIDGKYVGFAGQTSQNYWNQDRIAKHCNNIELRSLTRHPSAAVKACAFLELKERRYMDLKTILDENLGNKETFSYFPGGCVGSEEQVNFFLLKELYSQLTHTEYEQCKQKMSEFYNKAEWAEVEKGIDFSVHGNY